MTTATTVQLTPMGINQAGPYTVKDDSSDAILVAEHDSLSVGSSVDHTDHADLKVHGAEDEERNHVKLQDAIVTTLFNAAPDTLKLFLSPTVHTFKAVFGKRDVQLVIWRKGLEVFIGTFENHSSLKVYGFKHVAGVLIGYDGTWHLKATAENAYSNPKWNGIWAGKFESYGGVARMSVEFEEAGMAKQALALAESILENKYWELRADIKAT